MWDSPIVSVLKGLENEEAIADNQSELWKFRTGLCHSILKVNY